MNKKEDKSNYIKIGQEEYKKCFVCYLDILGFKELVESRHPEPLHFLLNYLRRDMEILCRKSSIQWLFISDSLLLFTLDDSEENFDRLTGIVSAIIPTAFSNKFPIRGAISYGDFYFNKESSIFFGPAYLTAVKYEKKQEWAGVILTPDCTDFIMSHNYNSAPSLLIKYDVPLKEDILEEDNNRKISYKHEKMICINWIKNYSIDKKIDKILLESDFSWFNHKASEKHLNKIENTLKFLKYCNQLGGDD